MHFCFSLFSSKRGRPKLDQKEENIFKKEQEADLLSSLFYLNKINKKQLASANFYQQLYKEYQKSIEGPSNNTCSIIKSVEQNSSSKNHNDEKDLLIYSQWTNLKKILSHKSNYEEVLYRVLIEQKMSKSNFFNPTRVNQNLLQDLQGALDKITEYRNKLDKKIEFHEKRPQIMKYLKVNKQKLEEILK